MHKRRDIEWFAQMRQHVADDSGRALAEHVTKHAVKLQVGDGKAILRTVCLAGGVGGQLDSVAAQVAELADIFRRSEAAAHEVVLKEVGDPHGVLLVRLLALDGFDELGMTDHNTAALLEDVVYREPVFSGGFHTNVFAVVLGEPSGQVPQPSHVIKK